MKTSNPHFMMGNPPTITTLQLQITLIVLHRSCGKTKLISTKANIHAIVDFKVKIIMKNEKKQSVLHDGQPTYHCDTLAADHTDCVKLVLWEGKIDGVLQKVIPF